MGKNNLFFLLMLWWLAIGCNVQDGKLEMEGYQNLAPGQITATSINFGSQLTGTLSDLSYEITNNGEADLTLSDVSTTALGLAAPFSLSPSSTCFSNQTLKAKESCQLIITFAPSSGGLYQDSIDVVFYDGGKPQVASIVVTGQSFTPAFLVISDGATYNFGAKQVASDTDYNFTITNTGDNSALLGTVSTAGLLLAGTYSYQAGGSCTTGLTLGAGLQCSLIIRFTPSAEIPFSDVIELAYNDGNSPQIATRSLLGLGDSTPPSVLSVAHLASNGTYGDTSEIDVTVTFSENVTVDIGGGTPRWLFETGATDRYANYISGSGGTTLTFRYTVQAGDNSADLDYNNTAGLEANGGTIRDSASNNATLTLPAVGTLPAAHTVVIDTTGPTVSSVAYSTANGIYNVPDNIDVTVTFSENVTVTTGGGTPRWLLETGATDRYATYISGSGGTTLTFRYTVQAGDTSADLDYNSTAGLSANGGTIRDGVGNSAILTLPAVGTLAGAYAIVIDTGSPTVASVAFSTGNGFYNAPDTIDVTVTFNENITVDTGGGTPRWLLETGSTDRYANYISGSGTTTLTFRYTVVAGDTSSDLDYNSTTGLEANGGTLRDTGGNNATLTLPAVGTLAAAHAIVIDTTAPTVASVAFTTGNGSYGVAATIDVTVTFNENITVDTGGGTPRWLFETGATDRYANYISGSGGTTLTFRYTVVAGDASADLDYNITSGLETNLGTMQDSAGNNATLTLPAVGTLALAYAVVIETTAPTVTSVAFTTANGTYNILDDIDVTVTFTENVTVDTGGGTPRWLFETGATDRYANYISGSGGTTLTFRYSVQAGDVSADLDYNSTAGLDANGGTIRDGATNNAILTLPAVGTLAGAYAVVVDGILPTVSSVAFTTGNGSYNPPDTIDVTVTFTENVTVDTGGGTPRLILETGASDGSAFYISGSGGTTLTFRYTVQAGHTSADLDYNTTAGLSASGGTIRDSAGNDATLTLPAVGTLAAAHAIVIDGVLPTVSSVAYSTANGSYNAPDNIDVTVTFNENITVGGTPRWLLETGTTDRYATYISGSGGTTLTFRYTVQAGDTSADLDYNSTAGLEANGGTLQDSVGNDATLTLPAVGTLAAAYAIVIDTASPTVSSVAFSTANGTYNVPDNVDVTVTFTENITVGGTPRWLFETGATDRYATYISGSGGTTLTFRYTVQAGDTSADLDYNSTAGLEANGGTLRDPAGNDANLALPAVGTLAAGYAIVIDTANPTVTSVAFTSGNGTYSEGTTIDVTATFNENVTVGGTPRWLLETGTTDRYATYLSGSGTTILTFRYTVVAGDTSADLDYNSTAGLELNGGTIQDSAGNNATLTLPAVGTLAAAHAIVVDTTGPAITAVAFSSADGTYYETDTIDLTVEFSENVLVTGTPTLTLETGTTDRDAIYISGDGTNILTFRYTVQTGDSSTDLDYVATNSLTGTIKDAAGNNANLTLPAVGTLATAHAIVLQAAEPMIFAGSIGGCSISAAGVGYCWGYGPAGGVGDDFDQIRYAPTAVVTSEMTGSTTFKMMAPGRYHACGIATDGVLYCWGGCNSGAAPICPGGYGTIGVGTLDGSFRPLPVDTGNMTGDTTFKHISAAVSGGGSHSCGISTDNIAYCWGENQIAGATGDGSTTGQTVLSPTPVDTTPIVGATSFLQIGTGHSHTCGITTDGIAYCWGWGAYGKLGDNTTNSSDIPVAVDTSLMPAPKTFKYISSGGSSNCGIDQYDKLFCWGLNDNGQLGVGDSTDRWLPTPVAPALSFKLVDRGSYHTCAITTSDVTYCWGNNDKGQVGDGTIFLRSSPVMVNTSAILGFGYFKSISLGGGMSGLVGHTCAMADDNQAYCWGTDAWGAIGNGGGDNGWYTTPMPVNF